MTSEPGGTPGLVRSMRRWDLVGVVVNGVIGAGIFGLPSKIFSLAGPYSIFAFLICAVCVAAIVLCFAEVASRYSGTGGPFLYASEARPRSVSGWPEAGLWQGLPWLWDCGWSPIVRCARRAIRPSRRVSD